MREYNQTNGIGKHQSKKLRKKAVRDLLRVMHEDGFLTYREAVALKKTCHELCESPVRILRSLNIASPRQIQFYLRRFFGIEVVSDEIADDLDEESLDLIPGDLVRQLSVFPVAEAGSVLMVAMEDPLDKGVIHKLEFFLGRRIRSVSATHIQIAQVLTRRYGIGITELKLTSVLEASRGVWGGIPHELAGIVDSAVDIDKGEGDEELLGSRLLESLEEDLAEPFGGDDDSDNAGVEALVEKISREGAVQESQSASVWDEFESTPEHVSLDVESTLVPEESGLVDEFSSDDIVAKESSTDDFFSSDGLIDENPSEQSRETEFDETPDVQIPPEYLSELAAAVNACLIKLGGVSSRKEVLDLVNSKLTGLSARLDLQDENTIECVGPGFQIQFPLSSEEIETREDPIGRMITPVVRRMQRMKQ